MCLEVRMQATRCMKRFHTSGGGATQSSMCQDTRSLCSRAAHTRPAWQGWETATVCALHSSLNRTVKPMCLTPAAVSMQAVVYKAGHGPCSSSAAGLTHRVVAQDVSWGRK